MRRADNKGMRAILAIIMMAAMTGCSTVGVTRLKDAERKPSDCKLEIFTDAAMVKRPFEELCLLDSRTGSTAFHDKTAAGAIENAKADACACGADAIIVGGMGSTGAGYGSWGNGTAFLKAIRFTGK